MATERRNRQQWRAIFDDFETSGQSATAYCAERGLNAGYFSKQRQKLRRGSAFVAVRAAPSAPITVQLGEIVVRCGAETPPAWIAALAAQLRL